ncbi:MAG: hypothetical protein NXI20_24825 [bacterium]|nr:hypothetical protein [bacterium]
MHNKHLTKNNLIRLTLWLIIVLSGSAIIYHTRWLIPYLVNSMDNRVPTGQSPAFWFISQIGANIIFLYIGFLLLRTFSNYQKKGYFDKSSLRIFDQLMYSSLGLALLTIMRVAFSDFYLLSITDYFSIEGIVNFLAVLIIDTITFKEPQTVYILLAIIMWVMKQFMIKALSFKQENEAFI